MEIRFKIVYVVKFFDGLSDSGTLDVFTSVNTTKSQIEMEAMKILMDRWTATSPANPSLNIQKVDITVSEIK
ncbi:hypothetical protein [Sphingobacterium thalpophilum]|uniref:hypothetical protein n=1 Tax=Sphingobacterium thalpophilum TaxID=259 RepID=UPI0024A78FC2|nr:hypothetical protein [Sphingobacterium thalpophilum]